jgi:hypothetical protein
MIVRRVVNDESVRTRITKVRSRVNHLALWLTLKPPRERTPAVRSLAAHIDIRNELASRIPFDRVS